MESRPYIPPIHFIDLMVDAVCVVDADGCFRFVSAASERIFGYKPEEMIGRSTRDFIHPEDQERTQKVVREIMAGRPQPLFENRYRRKDGRYAHIMWSARWSEDEQVRIAVARDVTERKRAEALQRATYTLSQAANEHGDLSLLCERIRDAVGALLPIERFAVALRDMDADIATVIYWSAPRGAQADWETSRAERLSAHVIHTGESLMLTPAMTGDAPGRADGADTLAVPMTFADGTAGALTVEAGVGAGAYTDKDREVLEFIAVQAAAAIEHRTMRARLEHMAQHDQLTGLPNRALFIDRLETAVTRARRAGNRIGVLYLDLDGFKQVNDTFGHAAGDELLRAIGERLSQCVRGSDTVGRLGGDEFVILLDGLEEHGEALAIMDKVDKALMMPYHFDAGELRVTPSIGIAVYPDDGIDEKGLLFRADQAMYERKRQQRRIVGQ